MSKLLDAQAELNFALDEAGRDEIMRDAQKFEAQMGVIKDLEDLVERHKIYNAKQAERAKPYSDNSVDPAHREQNRLEGPQYQEVLDPEDTSRAWRTSAELRLPAHRRDFGVFVREARARTGFTWDGGKHFKSFGEQLACIQRYYESRGADADRRLIRAPTGGYEGDPSSGGFLVQVDFASAVFARAYELGNILNATQKLTITTNANGIKIPGIDETSRATGSRWGGVQSYWVAEGTAVTASRPRFRLIELDLKKLMSIMYVTDELLADQNLLTTIASQAFSEELMFMAEDSIIEGSGAGQPQGILTAPALVVVPKETGQSVGSLNVIKENIDKMWSRMWVRSRQNAAWYINQDVEPALLGLSQVIGTAGAPVYLPPGGYNVAPYGMLFGRPVYPVEYCSALGTVGDIILADFSQYVIAQKGGMQAATSMHVAFLTDEMVFRITYRIDGEPLWNSALQPFKGSATKSPFVALATR